MIEITIKIAEDAEGMGMELHGEGKGCTAREVALGRAIAGAAGAAYKATMPKLGGDPASLCGTEYVRTVRREGA